MRLRYLGNGVTVILLISCVLLSAFIYKQWQGYSLETPSSPEVSEKALESRQSTAKAVLGGPRKTIQISQFSEILARPLFTEGRLPPEEPEPEDAQPQQVGMPKLKLEGVVISPESRVAVVRDLSNNSLIRLSEGMIHTGWRLTQVDNAEAVFERDDESFILPLELINNSATKPSTSKYRLPSKKSPSRRPRSKSP